VAARSLAFQDTDSRHPYNSRERESGTAITSVIAPVAKSVLTLIHAVERLKDVEESLIGRSCGRCETDAQSTARRRR